MKKVLVIGCPGSGKSYFSRKLSEKIGLPLCHLDMLFWNSDRTDVGREVFLQRLSEVLKGNEWIIDGNYSYSMEMRLAVCDTVFFFDLPTEKCLEGVCERRGKPRPDLPWNEADYPPDEEFIEFIKAFPEKRKPEILERLGKFPSVRVVTVKSREEADEILAGIGE